MRSAGWWAVLLLLFLGASASAHGVRHRFTLLHTNRRLHGKVLDFTHNHGADRSLYSPSLGEKRDMYVYLPPDFDPNVRYPLIIFLHGFAQDETAFLTDVIEPLDQAIADGIVPPAIIAAPDGSLHGISCLLSPGTFFINSQAGRFEDYLMTDVWNFLFDNFPLRPEPEAHAVVGVSMGGGAAVAKVIKYPDRFKVCVGVFPPVNLRWLDCHCRYMANFDPDCWGWRTEFRRREVVGRFYGVVTIRMKHVIGPLYDRNNPGMLDEVRANNPIEMLDIYDVQPGQFSLYIAYAGKDQFNIDAQVESFLYVARHRGLDIAVAYEPNGKHDRATVEKLRPAILRWLGHQLAAYGPLCAEPQLHLKD
jgi:pimeloyl-ACP methyl ester carboxylesterase